MSDIKFNQFVSKNWGYEKIIVNGQLYCGKILHFVKDRSCSFHYHIKKTETFYISFGKIEVLYQDSETAEELIKQCGELTYLDCHPKREILEKGDSFHIKPFLAHKMIALEDSEIIEFSTQDFSDDSYRLIKGD